MSLVASQIDGAIIADFQRTIESRPGRFLMMDPAEVLAGGLGADSDDRCGFAGILMSLESVRETPELVWAALRPYVGELSADTDKRIGQVIGYTYS